MEEELPKVLKEIEAIDGFNDYYYFPENFSVEDYELNHLELCKIARPVNFTAQALTTVVSVVGILMNCIVIYVMVILKEYRKTPQHWLLLHFLVSNVVFLLFVFFQMVNEHHGRWIMGDTMCKFDEASIFTSRAAGIVFLVLSNFLGFLSYVGFSFKRLPSLPWKDSRMVQIIKYFMVLICVWVPCAVANLPLYKFNNVNDCERCVLEFPIDIKELCPMLGLNSTACTDVMIFFTEGGENETEYDDDNQGDIYTYSGRHIDTEILEDNITEMAQMMICEYEEPRSFFVWLLASFTLFYAMPIPILVVFGCIWFYDAVLRKTKKNKSQNKTSLLNVIFILDCMFLICWTPWNVVHMKKAYGGLGRDGYRCASLIHYARFSALIYNAFAPVVYALLTKDFRTRALKALNLSTSFCYDILRMDEKSPPESRKLERATSSSEDRTTETSNGTDTNPPFMSGTSSPAATPV